MHGEWLAEYLPRHNRVQSFSSGTPASLRRAYRSPALKTQPVVAFTVSQISTWIESNASQKREVIRGAQLLWHEHS